VNVETIAATSRGVESATQKSRGRRVSPRRPDSRSRRRRFWSSTTTYFAWKIWSAGAQATCTPPAPSTDAALAFSFLPEIRGVEEYADVDTRSGATNKRPFRGLVGELVHRHVDAVVSRVDPGEQEAVPSRRLGPDR